MPVRHYKLETWRKGQASEYCPGVVRKELSTHWDSTKHLVHPSGEKLNWLWLIAHGKYIEVMKNPGKLLKTLDIHKTHWFLCVRNIKNSIWELFSLFWRCAISFWKRSTKTVPINSQDTGKWLTETRSVNTFFLKKQIFLIDRIIYVNIKYESHLSTSFSRENGSHTSYVSPVHLET